MPSDDTDHGGDRRSTPRGTPRGGGPSGTPRAAPRGTPSGDYGEAELDEELPGSLPRSARRRTLFWVIGALVVLALLAAGITRVVSHTSHPIGRTSTTATPSTPSQPSTPSANPSSATSPVAVNAPPPLSVLRRLGAPEIAAARAECPRLAPTCVTTGETPTTVIGALRSEFPGARQFVAVSDIAYSDTSGPRLVYRLLSARAGSITLTVEVRQSQSGDGTTSQRVVDGTTSTVNYQRRMGSLTIEIQADAPTGHALDLTRLARITDRPGLLATG